MAPTRRRSLVAAAAAALRTPGGKIPQVTTDPTIATAPEPTAAAGLGQNKIEISTRTISPPLATGRTTEVLYDGDRLWARVVVELKTAGPVAVGTSSELAPVGSGKGILLTTDQPVEFIVARSNKLYIAVTALNRVSLTVMPIPWLEQIAALVRSVAQSLVSLATGKGAP